MSFLSAGKDIVFPSSCQGCLRPLPVSGESFCEECFLGIAFITSPQCMECGREFSNSTSGDHLCDACLRRKKKSFFKASAVTHYQEPVSTLLRSLKYDGDLSVLPALQTIVNCGVPVILGKEDRVVPVPLHIKRLRSRGFNQAVLIARLFFSDNLSHILVDVLQRVRHTDPQTGLDGTARRRNLRNAFTVSKKSVVADRKIILVDDVYTTGTTVLECSRVLLAAGAEEVRVLTLARVQDRE